MSGILDHNRAPRNFRPMPEATGHGEGYNPLCGDQITVYLKMKGDKVEDVSFQGSGCENPGQSYSVHDKGF